MLTASHCEFIGCACCIDDDRRPPTKCEGAADVLLKRGDEYLWLCVKCHLEEYADLDAEGWRLEQVA